MRASQIRCAIASWLRRPPSRDALAKELQMVTAQMQAVVDTLNARPDQIKNQVQTAIANAEAAKDQNAADGLAAVNAALDSVKATVAGIAPAAQ